MRDLQHRELQTRQVATHIRSGVQRGLVRDLFGIIVAESVRAPRTSHWAGASELPGLSAERKIDGRVLTRPGLATGKDVIGLAGGGRR